MTNFTEFKLIKSKYRFFSKRKRNNYFNKLLLQSGELYKQRFKEYLFEKLNVFFSWYLTMKYSGIGVALLSLLLIASGLKLASLITFGISILFVLNSLLIHKLTDNFYESINLTLGFMAQDGYIEETQNTIIEEQNNNG